jgi:hypothetical protein
MAVMPGVYIVGITLCLSTPERRAPDEPDERDELDP